MALPNATILSAAVARNDTAILLASVSDVALGNLAKIEDEFVKFIAPLSTSASTPQPVLRGQEGTAQVAHVTGIAVKLGANPSASVAGDWGNPTAGAAQPVIMPRTRATIRREYVAAGAIAVPGPGENMIAVVDGTSALAMTLASPSTLNDGDKLTVVGNGKAAHTVTYTAGLGNVGATADVLTFAAGQQQAFELIAAGGFWQLIGAVAGAATIAGVGIG